MKVKELIEKLQEFNPDADVVIHGFPSHYDDPVFDDIGEVCSPFKCGNMEDAMYYKRQLLWLRKKDGDFWKMSDNELDRELKKYADMPPDTVIISKI